MSRYRKLTTICAAAMLALGLAACGGGGSSPTSNVTDPPVDPTPPAPMDLALPTGHGISGLESGASETFTVKAGNTNKYGNTNFACPADGEDCSVTVTNTLGTYSATSTGGMVTAALDKPPAGSGTPVALPAGHGLSAGTVTIAAGDSRTTGDDVVIRCPAGGEACVLTLTAERVTGIVTATYTGGQPTFHTAAVDPTDDQTAATRLAKLADTLGANPVAGNAPAYLQPANVEERLTVEYGSLTVKIDEDGNPKTANKVEFTAGAAPASLGDGWQGTTLQRTVSGTEETITVYSNIEAAKEETFATAYGRLDGTNNPGQVDQASPTTIIDTDFKGQIAPGTPSFNAAATNVDVDADRIANTDAASKAQFWKLAASKHFPTEAGGESEEIDQTDRVPGTFDGVSGTFSPGADDSTVDRDTKGNLTSTATWTFTAGAGNQLAKVATKRPDNDYLVFGWWENKPLLVTASHGLNTFFYGKDSYNAYVGTTGSGTDNLTQATGTAEYAGPAAGKYVARTPGSDAHMSGSFTASAKLTAKFGTATAAGSISGAVTGFKNGDGNDLANWRVSLGQIPLTAATGTVDSVSTFSGGTASGMATGGLALSGGWDGEFFGNTSFGTTRPTSVGGQFNAHGGTVTLPTGDAARTDSGFVGLAGGFGANESKFTPASP